MSEQEKLLPCPFCGGEANAFGYGEKFSVVHCNNHSNCTMKPEINTKISMADAVTAWNTRLQPATDSDVVDRVARAFFDNDKNWQRPFDFYIKPAKAAIAAMQPAIDKAVAEERARCERLCSIYFDIAAGAIGEDEVRRLRDKAIEQGG